MLWLDELSVVGHLCRNEFQLGVETLLWLDEFPVIEHLCRDGIRLRMV